MPGKKKKAAPRDLSQPGDVIPSLMDVLSEAMAIKGKDHADVLPLMRKDDGKPLGVEQIKRYLARTHFPTGRGIDQWARAVAKATEAPDRFAFFRAALEQAEMDEKPGRSKRGAGPRTARDAAQQALRGVPKPKKQQHLGS